MGLRALLTLVITAAGWVGAFFHAFYGLIAYAFWSYTYPEQSTWGTLPLKSLSYITGAVLVLATIMQEKKLFLNNAKCAAMIMFWVLCFFGVVTGGHQDLAQWQFQFFTRVILIALIITVLVNDIDKFKAYAWTIVIFIGFIAAQSGIRGVLSGATGGASSGFVGVVGERNAMGGILCTVIPMVLYMIQTTNNKWIKIFLLGVLLGDIFAVYMTFSRGAFIGLVCVSIFMIMRSKKKFLIGAIAIFVVYMSIPFIPQAYIDRLSTMAVKDESQLEGSAAGRLMFWRSAIEMMKENPVTGVGFHNSENMMERYPDPLTKTISPKRAIHNSILQVGAELGIPALILYIGIFTSTYLALGRLRKLSAAGRFERKDIGFYASMLQACFIGFFSTAFFVNLAYIDISWHMCGLTVALEVIAYKGLLKEAA